MVYSILTIVLLILLTSSPTELGTGAEGMQSQGYFPLLLPEGDKK